MTEEEFSLGDSFENDDFSLGDFPLPMEAAVAEPVKVFSNDTELDEIQKIYDILRIKDKDAKIEWEDFFKSDFAIFELLGKKYFEVPTEEEIEEFSKKSEKWIACAHKNWIDVENQHKTELLTEALQELLRIYKKFPLHSYFDFYVKAIKNNLKNTLNKFLNQKITDKILEVGEILELIEFAISIHYIPDTTEGRKSIIDAIRKANQKNIFKIESYQETFVRTVKQKSEFERLNTEFSKAKLFEEYKKLANISAQVNETENLPSDSELFDEMNALLYKENLFVDNVEFYRANFFEKEKAAFKGNFSLPHTDEDFYYYKGTAKNLYQFSEEQWNEFIRVEKLIKDDSASLVFIMGTEKALTVAEIADLIEANPMSALSRILAGDLETYLTHIGQVDLSKRVFSIKEELKNEPEVLVQSVVNLLKGIDSSETENEEDEEKIRRTISALIEKDAGINAIVSCLLSKKQYEKLNKKFLSSSSSEHTELNSYLLSKGYSFIKLCMNYLNEFPEENNALAYKNMYENYAAYVLTKLSENADSNGAITFVCVFKPILEGASNKNLLSQNFMKKFSEIEKVMTEKLGEEENNFSKQQETKPKKTFFGFRK